MRWNVLAGRILQFCEQIEKNPDSHWAVQAFVTTPHGKKIVETMIENAKKREANSQLLADIDVCLEEFLVSNLWELSLYNRFCFFPFRPRLTRPGLKGLRFSSLDFFKLNPTSYSFAVLSLSISRVRLKPT